MAIFPVQGVTNVHISNVHFVLRDISALLDGREVVKAKILAENEGTFEKCTFVPS